jgi:hypothetical protein
MVYLCSQFTPNVQVKYFMSDWSICRLFDLKRVWKRGYLQIMVFVHFCSTWGIVELKTRFETWVTRNDVNGEGLFHLHYLITIMAYLSSQRSPNVQFKYFMFDWSILIQFVLNSAWKRDSLQMTIFVYVCSTWSIVELNTRFETWINRNDVNGVNVFHLSYFITPMAYLCSQLKTIVQIKYFMFDWSIYKQFVLNKDCELDSLEIKIFVYVSSTWSMVELKTRFETWIKGKDVNGVCLIHHPNLVTLMAYLCSQWTQNFQVKILRLIGRSTDYMC